MNNEVKPQVELKNIRNVNIKSDVETPKDGNAKIVTSVSFKYDGPPSQVQDILKLEASNIKIDATFHSPQASLGLFNKEDTDPVED